MAIIITVDFHGARAWSCTTIFRNCVTRKSLLCTIYQANPLDSLDKLGGCFVLLYRARIDLRAPFRVLSFLFREVSWKRMETERHAFRAYRISIRTLFTILWILHHVWKRRRKLGIISKRMTCYDRDNKFIVKINFTLHNFFHLVVEYNKYTYRRDITMSLTLETSDNRRERHW